MTTQDKIRRLVIIEKQTHALISDLQVREDLPDKEFEESLKGISENIDCLNSFYFLDKSKIEWAKKYHHCENEIYDRASGQERGE